MQSTYFKYLFLILNLIIIVVFLFNFQDFSLYQRFLLNNGYTITLTLFIIYLSHLSLKLTDLIVESIKRTENPVTETPLEKTEQTKS